MTVIYKKLHQYFCVEFRQPHGNSSKSLVPTVFVVSIHVHSMWSFGETDILPDTCATRCTADAMVIKAPWLYTSRNSRQHAHSKQERLRHRQFDTEKSTNTSVTTVHHTKALTDNRCTDWRLYHHHGNTRNICTQSTLVGVPYWASQGMQNYLKGICVWTK